MKAIIITDKKRNALDCTIDLMMGIETKTRNEEKKGSPYNVLDYALAIGSSSAVAVTMVLHPDVAVSALAYGLVKNRLKKKEKEFYETSEEEICEEEPVIEGEIVDTEPAKNEVHEAEVIAEPVLA